jgi:hypothetical protein
VSALLAFAIASLAGYCGVRLWLPPGTGSPRWTPALHAALGIGLGTGFTSCLYWLLVVIGVGTLPVIAGVEIVLLGALAALALRQRSAAGPGAGNEASPDLPAWIPGLGLAVMLGLFVAAFLSVSDLNPQGGGTPSASGICGRATCFIPRPGSTPSPRSR